MQPDRIAQKIRQALATAKKLQASGHFGDARRACELVLKLDAGNVWAHIRLGLIARQERQGEAAIAHFTAAVEAAPNHIYAIQLLARTLREKRRLDEAEALLDRILPVLPRPVLKYEKGRCLLDRDATAEAVVWFEEAAAEDPKNAEIRSMLGIARRRNGDKAGAVAAFRTTLDLNPEDVAALNGLGNDALEHEDFAEAANWYRRALAIQPGFAKAQKNLAYTLSLTNDTAAARAAFERIFEIRPNLAEAHMDYGLFLLSIGDYARGWQEYEHRWRFDGFGEQDWGGGLPRWDGTSLQGRHLLLWGEQGIGDHILYGTMLPDAIRRAAGTVTVAVEPRLVPLFARALMQEGVTVVERGATVPADMQCPFGSLGQWLRTDPSACSDGRYLKADAARSTELRRRYAALGRPGDRLVGLSWRSANWHVGHYKSLSLETLLPVLQRPGLVWVSLQYGDVAAEIADFAKRHGVAIHQDTEIDAMRDLDGLAAQVAALNAVVSSSNSTVHIAGALGVPCDILLSVGRGRMWYWPASGTRSPWYDSVRLIRQAQPGDWSAALQQLSRFLDAP
ncbi:MAG: tetratricopeptide repeat protein [Ferrovibrio sp.]|uniref:tetratricopeptide repeat protein n=1 Tax=Ferrovibrio sp. TaxID=1917215 RepID=UPI00261CEDE1|nr:tetratricopeptide repeat protein [Ferrovibrio sp.]MCW0233746.1 tetratricopeptide repeat protein [Ferrovibrio sp.]